MLKKTSTEIVVQSNYLVESSYRLNFQEKRLIAWLSTKIRKDDVDFKKYDVKFDNYFDDSGRGQKSPGVFLSVSHSKIQKEVNKVIFKN